MGFRHRIKPERNDQWCWHAEQFKVRGSDDCDFIRNRLDFLCPYAKVGFIGIASRDQGPFGVEYIIFLIRSQAASYKLGFFPVDGQVAFLGHRIVDDAFALDEIVTHFFGGEGLITHLKFWFSGKLTQAIGKALGRCDAAIEVHDNIVGLERKVFVSNISITVQVHLSGHIVQVIGVQRAIFDLGIQGVLGDQDVRVGKVFEPLLDRAVRQGIFWEINFQALK